MCLVVERLSLQNGLVKSWKGGAYIAIDSSKLPVSIFQNQKSCFLDKVGAAGAGVKARLKTNHNVVLYGVTYG